MPKQPPHFSLVTAKELEKLSTARVSGCAFACYTALCYFARSDNKAHPSIVTLMNHTGNAWSRIAYFNALKQLENKGLIIRQNRRSKARFILPWREL